MSDYNKNQYGSVEYYEEELMQKTLIAELVKEAAKNRLTNSDDITAIEYLSKVVLSVTDSVEYAEKAFKEAKAKKGVDNGEPV